MMIKVSGGYLDFSEEIEVSKQIKLFEEIATTDGDFSYSFEIERTSNNTRLLDNPLPDVLSKPVYQKIPATLLSDEGTDAYTGYLRIERVTDVFSCSFFSGNNNWFGMLAGPLQDIDWSAYDVDQTEANIISAVSNTEGVVFPLVDNGVLDKRGFQLLKIEDFVGAMYVKTIFSKIFQHHSIKLAGELLDDPNYQTAITLTYRNNEQAINDRSSYVFTNNSPIPNDGTFYQMVWTDDSTLPYFDGAQDNFSLVTGRYTADVRMTVKVEAIINTPVAPLFFYMRIFKNGSTLIGPTTSNDDGVSISAEIPLDVGDYIDIRMSADAGHGSPTTITDATVKITPVYIYKAFGDTIVPNWTQQKYVSNVLSMFCTLASFNNKTQTLTINIFEKIKNKPPIDLSPHIASTEVDYTDFISDYGKQSLFSYQKLDHELKANFIPYSKGALEVDNDFIEDQVDVVESDLTQPVGYLNSTFKAHLEKTNLIDLEQETEADVTAVTNNSGIARFAVSEDVFAVNDIVRISDSTNATYNGDYMVNAQGAGYIELQGVAFANNASAKAGRMKFIYNDSDDVFILHYVPDYAVSNFSALSSFQFESNPISTVGYAFFQLIATGRQVDEDFIYSLSFSGNQVTMIDQYFNLFSRVLNDPVKLISEAYVPHKVFRDIDFLRPVTIRTEDTSNLYYVNKISGYLDSIIELVKLP